MDSSPHQLLSPGLDVHALPCSFIYLERADVGMLVKKGQVDLVGRIVENRQLEAEECVRLIGRGVFSAADIALVGGLLTNHFFPSLSPNSLSQVLLGINYARWFRCGAALVLPKVISALRTTVGDGLVVGRTDFVLISQIFHAVFVDLDT